MKARPLAKRVVGLTGTPSANGLMDLWAEFRLLDMGKRLGRFITHYREERSCPISGISRWCSAISRRPGAEDEIYQRIGDITISMRSAIISSCWAG